MFGSPVLGQAKGNDVPDPKLDSPFAAFRLGFILSPVASIDGGLDITFPRLRIGEQWTSRVDFDASARFNSRSFGSRRDAELAVTFNQVYTPGGVNRGRFFLGAGIGQTFGPKSGVSGKVFGGVNISRVVSIEVEGQFPPGSPVRLALMGRLSAL
jgi:hypothetical protein